MDELEGVDTDLIVRPFMQKGTIVSLREFAVKAMNQHFGMQASERFGDAMDHDADGRADELSRGDMTALVMFQATLPAPVRVESENPEARAASERGEALFSSIGCASCHVPELPLENPVFSEPNPFNPSGKLQVAEVDSPYEVDLVSVGELSGLRKNAEGHIMVPVFTDLKRHSMGDVLNNETLEEEGVPTGEWLTRKLWGFASEPPFLHHGRATLMSEAILAHGGEALESRRLVRRTSGRGPGGGHRIPQDAPGAAGRRGKGWRRWQFRDACGVGGGRRGCRRGCCHAGLRVGVRVVEERSEGLEGIQVYNGWECGSGHGGAIMTAVEDRLTILETEFRTELKHLATKRDVERAMWTVLVAIIGVGMFVVATVTAIMKFLD